MNLKGKWMLIYVCVISMILIAAFLMHYVFGIYEVIYQNDRCKLYADGQTVVKIEAVPLNALGTRALFRTEPAEFSLLEGKDLVTVLSNDGDSGILLLKARNKTGTVIVRIKAKHSLLPSIIEIRIEPNAA